MTIGRFPLQDRTAVVLGADGPLGRELCLALDAAGARVVEADVELALEEVGPVDVLVVHSETSARLDRCCESIARAMSLRGEGSIVLVERAEDADGAANGRCEAMATRWEKHNVRVNALAHRALDRRADSHFTENVTPCGVSPQERRDEYRAALVFLASGASKVTGFRLVADGSWIEAVLPVA